MFLSRSSSPTNHLLRSASLTRGAAATRRLIVSTPTASSATPSRTHLLARQHYLTTTAAAYLTTTTKTAASNITRQQANVALGVLGGFVLAGLHSATGSQNEFFGYRFTTEKSPDDLASFYGGEEFMELFCIFPVVGQLMMRNGHIDENGDVLSTGIPGTLNVSMVFSDETNKDSGETDWFNKRERFRDVCFGLTCWDMVINFGFRTREDGQTEVYHFGEYFHGNLPVVSQVMKLVFQIQAKWLAWSAEHHINHCAFSSETEEEELEEESRRNMPLFLLQRYAWADLTAVMFGRDVDKPSFLLKKRAASGGEDDEEEDLLPIQRSETFYQISQDIAIDQLSNKGLLVRNSTETPDDALTPDDIKAVLTRSTTKQDGFGGSQRSNTYAIATEIALTRRRERRINRSLKNRASALTDQEDLLPIQRKETMYQISQDIATDLLATKGLLARYATESPVDVKAVLTRSTTEQDEGRGIQSNAYVTATQVAWLRHLSRAKTRRDSLMTRATTVVDEKANSQGKNT